jgi:hypothetical protein
MRIFKKDGHTDCPSKVDLASRSKFRLINGLEIPDYKERVVAQGLAQIGPAPANAAEQSH